MRVAINGFGRIGRQFFRAALSSKIPEIEFVAINGVTNIENVVYLLKYDSVYGRSGLNVKSSHDSIIVEGKKIKILNEFNPEKLPWKKLGIDLVVECTGMFRAKKDAVKHIKAGAKRVLISAISKDADVLIVPGVNDKNLKKEHKIISMASCTTNCVVPMLKVLEDHFGIKRGFMITTHGYTASQKLADGEHKDFRRGRSAAVNIIPTTTGATEAASVIIPQLKGKLGGYALRVPIVDGSIVNISIETVKKTSKSEVNNIFRKVAAGNMKGIIEYSSEPLVSTDILHNSSSCIFDSLMTHVNGDFVNVVGWYDNEWGYSSRLVDVVKMIKKSMK